MPQNITEVASWDTPLTAPADGDAFNGANLLTVFQKYADRLKLIDTLIGASGAAGSGVTYVRTFATSAAMKSFASPAAGQVALVTGTNGAGFYVWFSGTAVGDVAFKVYGGTSGAAGNWYSVVADEWGAANGIATLGAGGRCAQIASANAFIAIGNATYTSAGNITTTSGSYADLGGASPTVTFASGVSVGDKIKISGASFSISTGGTATGVRLVVVDGASTIAPAELTFGGITTAGVMQIWSTIYTVSNGPNITVKWQGNATGATNTGIGSNGTNQPSMLVLEQIRP